MHVLCDVGVSIKKEKLKETDLGTDAQLGKGCRFGGIGQGKGQRSLW